MARRPRTSVSSTVRVGVGPATAAGYGRRQTVRDKSGRFASNKDAEYVVPEVWRWTSLQRIHGTSLTGQMNDLSKMLTAWAGHVGANAPAVVKNALIPTYKKALKYTPYDTGKLYDSGRLIVDGVDNKKKVPEGTVKAVIAFAVNGLPYYAVAVHEIMTYHHVAPTRAKFLEFAVREDMGKIEEALIRGMKPIVGS